MLVFKDRRQTFLPASGIFETVKILYVFQYYFKAYATFFKYLTLNKANPEYSILIAFA